MAEVIAFYGSPGSGKTTVALKAAMESYVGGSGNEYVLFVSPDLNVPSNALLFPNYRPDELGTLSRILDSTGISSEAVLKNIVTVKSMKDFGCLGFMAGENRFSFPTPTADKINALFTEINSLAGYVFIDCTADSEDSISRKALQVADKVVRVLSPDLKGMSWLSSRKGEPETLINVVNVTEKELLLPVNEVCNQLKAPFVLPYSRALKQQFLDGEMHKMLPDKRYRKSMKALVKELL